MDETKFFAKVYTRRSKVSIALNKIMSEVMLDIETLSTRANAAILSIGAIRFSRDGPLKRLSELETFSVKIDVETCKAIGLHVDPKTEEWWGTQDEKIREEAFGGKVPIKEALTTFKRWFEGNGRTPKCDIVWANGDDFDCTIMTEAYHACGIPVPWKFWNTRDCRTAYDLGGVSLSDYKGGKQHSAVYDCYYQIVALKAALDRIYAGPTKVQYKKT